MELASGLAGSIVIGIVAGAVYGLIGVGIVLIYKTQRVVNFAQAEFGTLAAFVLNALYVERRLPVPLAVLAAVTVSALLALLVERVVIRPLVRESHDIAVFVATAGVALLVISLTLLVGGVDIAFIPSALGARGVRLAGLPVSYQDLLAVVVLGVVAVLLAVLFRTAVGRVMLALSEDPFAARLAGVSVSRLSMLVWTLAGVVAGIAGVLYAPNKGLYPGLLTATALFPALTGVVLGGLDSVPGALAGGLMVGLAQSLAVFAIQQSGVQLAGADTLAVFVILLGVLFLRPQGLLSRAA